MVVAIVIPRGYNYEEELGKWAMNGKKL